MTFASQKQQIPAAEFGPPSGAVIAGAAESEGTSEQVPRADHEHAFPVSGAVAVGDRLVVASINPTTLEWAPAPGAAVLNPNPPLVSVTYQNGLAVPIAVMVGISVAAGGTAYLGVSPVNPPVGRTIATMPSTAPGPLMFPLAFIVPPGWYWAIGGAASIATAQAVTL